MNREAFVGQVATAMAGKLDNLERFLGGGQGSLRTQVFQRARELAEQIEDPNTRAEAARAVMAGMFGHEQEEPRFWKTEVGVQVARAIGYHKPTVPFVTAAAILGVSRQRVYQLTRLQGTLRAVEGTNEVTRASLREVLLGQAQRGQVAA